MFLLCACGRGGTSACEMQVRGSAWITGLRIRRVNAIGLRALLCRWYSVIYTWDDDAAACSVLV